MEGKLSYLGREWEEEARKRLQTGLDPEKMNGITTSMINLYSACPDGEPHWMLVECKEGNLQRFACGVGEAPQAEFSISGPYSVFAAISRAELGSQRALMTGKLKLKGNMAKALRLAPLADRINKILSGIDAAY